MKTSRIEARVNLQVLERFDLKCKELGISRTRFIEKIANEPIIFLDNVRQEFKSKNKLNKFNEKKNQEQSLFSKNQRRRINSV